ncbi:OmpW family outer membrane protein [Rhodoferax sp.]|uniref:OmpW/AlkL family protein n=1 Tax=Rhodoferax sp. TaxID=50421 RepID=UPI0026339465|nr:OmpW family outer membrane protein [Rhodoferax sp.]MDD2811417.1 outer membrane beta-barrel protein [Rhodoferax sp.]MDD4943247.1 outer membrane beta-barrel protein [Rhodoferax sp.]
MTTKLKFVTAVALLTAGSAFAQTAGTWMVRAGMANITPAVTSGCLSAPDFGNNGTGGGIGCTRSNVGADTQIAGGVTYMYTDHMSIDVPLALPFKHKISGAGAMAGAGDLAEVQALPMTIFLQYRFLEASSKFRPYVGLGATYAYFFNEQGSGKLTATTNPGGSPTKLTVDSKFILTPQIGATIALNEKWFIDVSYSKSKLNTTTHFSTGQTMDVALDPASYSISVGYKF